MQPPIEKRRHFRNTNFVGDIAGAQSDTVMHCIKTNRVTNPLNPAYTSLDGFEMAPDQPKTKATLEAEASLRYAMENSMRQEQETLARAAIATVSIDSTLNNTADISDIRVAIPQRGVPPEFVPPRSSNQESDVEARDARIRQLEAEVHELRSAYSQKLPTQPVGQPMTMTNGFRAPSPGSQTMFRAPSPSGSVGSARSARSARSGMSGGSRDRMVLRSSDGRPRATPRATPREVREARQYQEDVNAVRDL